MRAVILTQLRLTDLLSGEFFLLGRQSNLFVSGCIAVFRNYSFQRNYLRRSNQYFQTKSLGDWSNQYFQTKSLGDRSNPCSYLHSLTGLYLRYRYLLEHQPFFYFYQLVYDLCRTVPVLAQCHIISVCATFENDVLRGPHSQQKHPCRFQ